MKTIFVCLLVVSLIAACLAVLSPKCMLPFDSGKGCTGGPIIIGTSYRYAYNAPTKACLKFFYNGCGGNDNNFPTKELCDRECS